MPIKIIEIKARCADPDRVREILASHGARRVGLDHQVDTYFNVPTGRLKLRQGNIESTLIFYHRPDQTTPKRSDVQLYQPRDTGALSHVLSAALSTMVVVDKQREIYFIDNVKIHLDRVEGLGRFVEIEAIDEHSDIGEERLSEQCNFFMQAFGISDEDLVPVSYSDLLLQQQ